jgi:hypothetical protein
MVLGAGGLPGCAAAAAPLGHHPLRPVRHAYLPDTCTTDDSAPSHIWLIGRAVNRGGDTEKHTGCGLCGSDHVCCRIGAACSVPACLCVCLCLGAVVSSVPQRLFRRRGPGVRAADTPPIQVHLHLAHEEVVGRPLVRSAPEATACVPACVARRVGGGPRRAAHRGVVTWGVWRGAWGVAMVCARVRAPWSPGGNGSCLSAARRWGGHSWARSSPSWRAATTRRSTRCAAAPSGGCSGCARCSAAAPPSCLCVLVAVDPGRCLPGKVSERSDRGPTVGKRAGGCGAVAEPTCMPCARSMLLLLGAGVGVRGGAGGDQAALLAARAAAGRGIRYDAAAVAATRGRCDRLARRLAGHRYPYRVPWARNAWQQWHVHTREAITRAICNSTQHVDR